MNDLFNAVDDGAGAAWQYLLDLPSYALVVLGVLLLFSVVEGVWARRFAQDHQVLRLVASGVPYVSAAVYGTGAVTVEISSPKQVLGEWPIAADVVPELVQSGRWFGASAERQEAEIHVGEVLTQHGWRLIGRWVRAYEVAVASVVRTEAGETNTDGAQL